MLRFWELAPSPNNAKVYMALRFKDIPFEVVPVDPFDRSALVEATGQELAPAIEDKGIVLNDSEAILQYLDATYRDTPRLFAVDRAGRKQSEAWKSELDKSIGAYWLPVFLTAIGRAESFEPAARDGFEQFLADLDSRLADRDNFGGPPIDDLRVAEWATYALPGPKLIERVRLFGKFKQIYAVPEGRYARLEAFLQPWQERLG